MARNVRLTLLLTEEEISTMRKIAERETLAVGVWARQQLVKATRGDEIVVAAAKAQEKMEKAKYKPDGSLRERDPSQPYNHTWIIPDAKPWGVNGWIKHYFNLDPFMRRKDYIKDIDKCELEISGRKADGLPLYYTEWPQGAEPGDPRITGPVYVDPHLGEPTTADGVLDKLLNAEDDED